MVPHAGNCVAADNIRKSGTDRVLANKVLKFEHDACALHHGRAPPLRKRSFRGGLPETHTGVRNVRYFPIQKYHIMLHAR